MICRSRESHDDGAALLIVLLLVSTLAALSVTVVQTVAASQRMTGYSEARGQAAWYIQGAEQLAQVRLRQLYEMTEGRITRFTPALGIPFRFSIEGGEVRARIEDGSNCFNLNSLAQPDESEDDEAAGPTPQPAVDARKFYVELLKALGFPQGEANRLMSTAADWLDADSNMRPLGAEAGFYAGLPEPRSIGNTFMVTPLELLDVYGYTPEIYRQIAPYVCARPGLQVGSFNVNTMTQRDAPLMVAVYNGQITLESMMAVMRQQSEIEHSDMEAFLSQPTLASIDPEQTVTSLLGLRSNYFRLSGEIVYLDSVSSYEAIFQLGEAGQAVLLRRRLGVDE
tara:strand:+ start:23564 stop:24580 length:1017 start_codon:yes stop_codon:yes gene_type:complete